MGKKYKCPYCDKRYEREKLIDHIEDNHEDMIPEHQTPTQVVFNYINKKDHGTCIVCKKPTKWNEKAGRYDRLCENPKCRETLREEFKKNAMKKDGTYVYTADPKFQEKMLRGRKISSTYKFTDGGKVDYVGSYEKKFLEFVDKVMNIESKDMISPGPTIPYEYNGKTHYWITDFYYVPGNLVLDIKDGGKNPNNRPMEEYREKQIAKENSIKKLRKYNYLRLTDNNFSQFMEVLADLKSMALNISERQLINKINESNIIDELSVGMMSVPPLYSSDASVLKAVDNEGKETTVLSSLDFNDSILIDDPIEGIKKVNKKYYKDNFVTKTQFLYHKDESYYNLLKAYKENNPCIYDGIYKNLSSFDNVITEDQIYFDNKFKLINNNPLQEMQNKIKEIDNSILCIGETTLIRNDKLNLSSIDNESIKVNNFYNELKVELESNMDGFFMITPSKDKENLDKQFQKYNSQNDDQKKKSDIRSLNLYGMNNYDHYHILLSKIKKGTKDDELDGLEYDRHDEEIVKEEYNYTDLIKYFNCKNSNEFKEKIEKAKNSNKVVGRVIIYPVYSSNELESLYMKYMALELNDRASSDNKAQELFGRTNREIYKYIQTNVINTKNDENEGTVKSDKEIKDDSVIANDTPLLTADELSKVEENYDCFNEQDSIIIRKWRGAYSLLNQGIKIPEYNKLNLDRINILRKSIYENNNEAIIQCGWIPGVEFNSENRVKATKIVKDKLDTKCNIINYDDYINEYYIEESNDKSYIDKNHKQNGQKRLSNFKFFKTKNNDDGESYNLFWKDDNDKVVGKVTVDSIPASDGYRWFGNLEVSNKYRGYGLGKQILDIAVNKYKAGALAVYKDNEIAYKMYKNYGFKESSNRKSKDYYYMYLERNKDKSIKESYIDESKIVKPEKCTKCGSTNIGVFIQGEPIFKCKDCGEYLGTVPVPVKESNTSNDNKKAISIVLVSGNTFVGKTIRKVQGNEFSHASISLDDDLKRIYSFNRRNGFNGLAYESIKQYIKEGVTQIAIYTFLVSDSVYKSIEKTLDNFSLFINQTKYSILNLLTIPLNIPLDMDMKMVCSEFVDKLLKASSIDLTNKKSYFVTPKDIHAKVSNDTRIIEVFRGNPKDFKSSEINKRINKLKRSNLKIYDKFLNESYIEEAKSFPIQFDKDGNLIIKNIRKINFEQEYADSHRLLMQYNKTNAYEPMKFELAKMQFFITLLEKRIYKQGKDKSKDELKVRARFLNDFKKYLKIVVDNDNTFNFGEYYEQSPFNDALIKINNSTLKYGWEALKYMIK